MDDRRFLENVTELSIFSLDEDYAYRYPDAALALIGGESRSAVAYYLDFGADLAHSPNCLFDLRWYVEEARRAGRAVGRTPLVDYLAAAGPERLSAHWLFEEDAVQAQLPALADAVAKGNVYSAYCAYLAMSDPRLDDVAPHWLFSPALYRRRYGAAKRPLADFLRRNRSEDLAASVFFDAAHYRSIAPESRTFVNPDGYRASPLEHFVRFGHRAGLVPSPEFDDSYYRRTYPDVAEAVAAGRFASPFEHFARHGHRQGRDPGEHFSSSDYLDMNRAVLERADAAGLSPFEHFMMEGRAAGLPGRRPLSCLGVPAIFGRALFEKRAALRAETYLRRCPAWEAAGPVEASFVVAVRDRFVLTASLLHQLHAVLAMLDGAFEVILVDAGSTDETSDLAGTGRLVVLRPGPRSDAAARNAGARAASGARLVFLAPDVEIEPGTVEGVLRDARLRERAVLTARTVAADGAPRAAAPLEAGDGPSGFLALSRAFFEALGGFDPGLSDPSLAAADLCLRARQAGGAILCERDWSVLQAGAAGPAQGLEREAFERRHAGPRPTDGPPPEAGAGPFEVLVVEDDVPRAHHGSGYGRTADIVEALLDQGISVSVWPIHNRGAVPPPRVRTGCRLRYLDIDGWGRDLGAHLAQEGGRYRVVWICRTHNFAALSAPAGAWRRADGRRRLIVDTEALDATRRAALVALAGLPVSEATTNRAVGLELGDLTEVDRVVAVSALDRRAILNATGREAALLAHVFDDLDPGGGWADRRDVGFLGAFHSRRSPNYDSLAWYRSAVLPHLRRWDPAVTTRVAGHARFDLGADPLFADGTLVHVGEIADLGGYFGTLRAMIAPTRFAGGLPHKVQNAMAHGVPVVMTELLARQLGVDGHGYPDALVAPATDPERFARGVARVLADEGLWTEARRAGLAHVRTRCRRGAFAHALRALVEGAGAP